MLLILGSSPRKASQMTAAKGEAMRQVQAARKTAAGRSGMKRYGRPPRKQETISYRNITAPGEFFIGAALLPEDRDDRRGDRCKIEEVSHPPGGITRSKRG